MEQLHAATLHLLRFGGMHPFKTTQPLNQIKISVRLVLWTLLLQLMYALITVYYLVYKSSVSSLHTFLTWVWTTAWALYPILIPIHFLYHAKEIAAACTRINNVSGMCSVNNLKMSIKIKLIIILLVLQTIYKFSVSVYIHTSLNCYNYEHAFVSRLIRIYANFYSLFIYVISSLIFVIYLAILEEYFSYHDSCLKELFDRRQCINRQIPVIPTRVYSDKPKIAATHPIGVQKSIHPQQSVNRIKTRRTLSYPRQTNDSRPSQQFTKSPRIRAKNVSTKTHVHHANMQDFIRYMEKIHASIFELYSIYELLKCIFGFPLLYMTIVITINSCASTYSFVVGSRVNCTSAILITRSLIPIFNILLITIVPHALDDKVSNVINISLIKVYQ